MLHYATVDPLSYATRWNMELRGRDRAAFDATVRRWLDYFRADMDTLAEVQPIYETLPGWRGNLTGARKFTDLPKEAQTYVTTLEKLIAAPIKFVSVGPERSATLIR